MGRPGGKNLVGFSIVNAGRSLWEPLFWHFIFDAILNSFFGVVWGNFKAQTTPQIDLKSTRNTISRPPFFRTRFELGFGPIFYSSEHDK